jgi:transposase
VRTQLQHNTRLNVIGAVVVSPHGRRRRLYTQMQAQSVKGEQIVAFLQHLLARVRGPLVLVWDNHPTHRRKHVQAFLAQHPRLHVFHFPPYAPELNPAEFVWTQTHEYLAGAAPVDLAELRVLLRAGLHRTRRSQARLRACLAASALPSFPWNT